MLRSSYQKKWKRIEQKIRADGYVNFEIIEIKITCNYAKDSEHT